MMNRLLSKVSSGNLTLSPCHCHAQLVQDAHGHSATQHVWHGGLTLFAWLHETLCRTRVDQQRLFMSMRR